MSNRPRLRRPGDYFTPLLDAFELGLLRRGTVSFVEIRHDPDCKRPDGGECTCRADVEIVITPKPRKEYTP